MPQTTDETEAQDRTVRGVAVVEDDDDLRELYAQYLESKGFVVVRAANGVEALVQIKRARPAAVVLDLFMPRLGGLEALRWIKAFDPAICVVVVTGGEDPALHQQALAAGASSTLRKPVSPETLLAALSETSWSGSAVSASRKATPVEPPTSLTGTGRVLIVDDEADVRALLEDVLAAQGYRVRAVTDGAEALRQVIDEPPDVVLLDIDMPRLGGVEALTAIRAVGPDVRVIMISGKASLDTAKLTLAYGAFDYVTKPFDLGHLNEVVAAALLWERSAD